MINNTVILIRLLFAPKYPRCFSAGVTNIRTQSFCKLWKMENVPETVRGFASKNELVLALQQSRQQLRRNEKDLGSPLRKWAQALAANTMYMVGADKMAESE